MSNPRINFVVAVARNGVIGLEGGMPWDLPEDLQHFKRVTMGNPIIMGRKTYESIGRPLPGRTNIIVTRNADYQVDGTKTVTSLDDGCKLAAAESNEIMIIGGGEIFNMAMDQVDRIYLTDIHFDPPGDAFFHFDRTLFQETERQDIAAQGDTPGYSFVTLDRKA